MSTIVTRAGKGSALTWTEGDANVTNLNNDKIEDIVEDTTPQLGGNLDVNGNSIVSVSNGDIAITPNGTGGVIIDGNEHPGTQGAVGQILVADGAGLLEWANQEKLTAKVINADSVTINKGEAVYVFSAQGDLISVKRAVNTGDPTSAQTLGLAAASIAASAEGLVICQGVLTHVDTSTYTAGQALYLGATAGSITTTKPKEPNHLVYLGFVEKVNASSGRIYVRIQNGYELDEIHDVNINNATALANNHLLRYNSTNTRWENAALDIVTDTTPQLGGNLDVNGNSIVSASNGNIAITPNGTGSIVLDGLNWPQADGNADYVLKTNGSGQLSWVAQPSAGATTLDGLTDVVITAAATNDVLVYNGTNWVDTAANTLTVSAASTATTATGATNINISTIDGNTSDTTLFPVLVGAASTGNQLPHIDSGALSFNASTNILSSTGFAGALNGTVGATTANTGAFTTLSATGAVTLSPASLAVAISPTGTGTVAISPAGALTINPTTASTINNTSIGATTASTGRFTTVTSTIATGTAPFTVASTTNVANLNASSLNGATFAAPGAIGSTTKSTAVFTTATIDTAVLDDIRETVAALTYGATITPDAADGSVRTITLTGNVTFSAFTNPVSGQTITLIITQDATGSRTLTSTMKFAGGSKTLSTAAASIDILTVSYIGTTYYASLSKAFA